MNGHDFRIFYEKYALYKIAEKESVEPYMIQHLSEIDVTSDYDLELLGKRYDVKMSNPVLVEKGKKAIWDFSLRKIKDGVRSGTTHKHCDFYFCIGMLNGIPKRCFIIPFEKAPTNHLRISICGNSKYHKYEI